MARRSACVLHEVGSCWRILIRGQRRLAGIWASSLGCGVEKAEVMLVLPEVVAMERERSRGIGVGLRVGERG